MLFTPIIGLEVHIELKTKSKMFCSCKADYFGVEPNTLTCPVCLGLPGALPVPNKTAIEWTILTGLALGGEIPLFSKFDRKNYFYPDLPKGYQISQYDMPLCTKGSLEINSKLQVPNTKQIQIAENSNSKVIRIRRVHLEEDTGKLIHQGDSTLIDFNRSGVPLMEIVTEPDMSSSEEVKNFLQSLQQIIRYLGVSEADMEKGQMRCEPTVNLEINKDKVYTPLVEIKNINSFRFVQKAIDFEIKRQLDQFEQTGEEKQPGNKTTRGWSETKGETFLQRSKEEAEDYRYFPEPDIPPLHFTEAEVQSAKCKVQRIELPKKKIQRFISDYQLNEPIAIILAERREKADYFEKAFRQAQGKIDSKTLANWIINKKVETEKISPEELIKAIFQKNQAVTMGENETRVVVEMVIKENPQAVNDYGKGKLNALEFLVGQVARVTKGQADPNLIRQILTELLGQKTT